MNTKIAFHPATLTMVLAALVWPLDRAAAADKTPNPTGTWILTTSTANAKSKPGSERTLKLKWEGGKLSGTLTKVSLVNDKSIVKERPIQDATLQGNNVSFSVTFPVEAGEGPDVTTKYQGQISGDTIKGKLETEWAGHIIKKDWEAKRSKQ